jgi:nucleotide-binding universal stress UspA family protein
MLLSYNDDGFHNAGTEMTQAPRLRILFPIDITDPHPEYFEQLKSLIPLKDVALVLLYVREELPAYEGMLGSMANFPDDFANQVESKAKEVLAELADKLKADCPNVTCQVLAGPATLMIEKVASDDKVDLIVMNAGSHSKVAKYLLGSTCERVVKQSATSVLVLKSSSAFKNLGNVVFGVDGSGASFAALSEAVSLLELSKRQAKATVVNVVHVTEIFKYMSPVSFVASVEDNLMMTGETSLAQAKAQLTELGLSDVETRLKDGEPVAEILSVVDETKAELVVVGGQGRSALEHFLVGSVSGKLTAHAKCSVFVAKTKN